MTTLHGYILRELLKTFALTTLALTGVFALCGSFVTILRKEALSAADVVSIMPLILPIVITMTLPIAALFAATLVYGRLAADNELTAARAAGINVHRLLLSAGLLAVFVVLTTGLASNYIIPRFAQRLDRFVRSNLKDLAYNQLRSRGFVRYGLEDGRQFLLAARGVELVAEKALIAKGFDAPGPQLSYFWVEAPAFLWINHDGEMRNLGVAKGALCQFDSRDEQLRVIVYMHEARSLEQGAMRVSIGNQRLESLINIPFPIKPSMRDLNTLLQWRIQPWIMPEVQRKFASFATHLRHWYFFNKLAERVAAGKPLSLSDETGRRLELRARAIGDVDGRPVLSDIDASVFEPGASKAIRYKAAQGRIGANTDPQGLSQVELRLAAVEGQRIVEYAPVSGAAAQTLRDDVVTLAGWRIPAEVLQPLEAVTAQAVLNPETKVEGDEHLLKERSDLLKMQRREIRSVTSIIHSRFGYSLSALVTVLIGAALGVIFRGSKALTAFGLACVPFAAVIVLLLLGGRLIESDHGGVAGPWVIWGGLAAMAGAAAVLIRVGVRR